MIAVVNKANRVANEVAALMARACHYQLRYHAGPAWGKTARPVVFFSAEADVPPGSWPIVIFDDADQAGILGWHSEQAGTPFGRVFAGPVLDNGGTMVDGPLSVSSVLSHEVVEAFCDPDVNLWAQDGAGASWALEACDPVESDSYPVVVKAPDGQPAHIEVSDFVFPAWFDSSTIGARFDWLHKLSAPFTLAPGGYAITGDGAVWGSAYPAWRQAQKEAEQAQARTTLDAAVGRSAWRLARPGR